MSVAASRFLQEFYLSNRKRSLNHRAPIAIISEKRGVTVAEENDRESQFFSAIAELLLHIQETVEQGEKSGLEES